MRRPGLRWSSLRRRCWGASTTDKDESPRAPQPTVAAVPAWGPTERYESGEYDLRTGGSPEAAVTDARSPPYRIVQEADEQGEHA